ncbi:MAG: DEAD/DEAH box helicase [Methylococcales bacterium]|nr:DEAD/DEAH box helicase [Methylococcales bacterium]
MKDKLLQRFNLLTEDEQAVALALAVIYAPITQTHLQELLKKTPEFKIKSALNVVRDALQKSQLITITADGWRCDPQVAETLIKQAVEKSWFKQLTALIIADRNYYYPSRISVYHAIKQLRVFLYQGNELAFTANIERFLVDYPQQFAEVLHRLFFDNYDAAWFASLSEQIRFLALKYYIDVCSISLLDCTRQVQLLEQFFGSGQSESPLIMQAVIEKRLMRGNFKDAENRLLGDSSAKGLTLLATLRFMENRNDEAIDLFIAALKVHRKETGKRTSTLSGLAGFLFTMALLRSRTASHMALLKQYLTASIKNTDTHDAFYLLNLILQDALDLYHSKVTIEQTHYFLKSSDFPYERLFQVLLLYWLGEIDSIISNKKNAAFLGKLADYCQQAERLGYTWYAAVSAATLQRLAYKNEACKLIAQRYSASAFNEIIDLLPQVAAWERALEALTYLKSAPANSTVTHELRMIWTLSLTGNLLTIEPREQKLGKNGNWSKGRPIALKRLYHELTDFDYLSEQDRRICAKIEQNKEYAYYSSYSKDVYEFPSNAILMLVGHPLVFWADQLQFHSPVDISVAEPQLLVKEQNDMLHISLFPEISHQAIITQKTASNGLLLTVINDQHRQVADILGKNGLTVPAKARQQVIDSIASIASMLTVQSDIGGTSSHAEDVLADSRLHIHLQPVGQGIQIEVFIQPFQEGGPLYKPGNGGATVLADIEGKQFQTLRDFALEKQHVTQLLNDCPVLDAESDLKWVLDDPELALEALLYLQELGEFVLLEWPKGKKIKISREAGLSQVQFSVRKEKDWFSVEGSVQIDDQQVLDMQRLMTLLNDSPGRFLRLEDGQVIALTRELRQRLDDLSGLGDVHNDKVRFHPLAAQALDEITSGMHIHASKPWQDQLRKLNETVDINPEIPSTLQGDLRDYQREGFQWMSRLAHWGAGACLADDMGLGKTVQALALILSRAQDGPTLILAPTSVCINWLEEAQRFAPTLNVQQFGLGDRQAVLDAAGAFDLIICSYGLLQTEGEKLAGKQWHTLVADEAQAIKNALTKRSKAAMALQADFKLITTGTPIENHLGELWNLFNFINPGLLGSLQKFNERYAQAIENQHDLGTQKRLRKLLRPFILRRLKNDVLTELPSRTEVTLHIELSPEERVFYEALRRSALLSMQAAVDAPGQQHLKILAEIMKLRRACCHPRLVMDESTLSSAKLQAFEELVDELLENRHKALVFSQFVGHLKLISELLDKKGIPYHYLDGSTPVAKRKIAVNSFQAGKGDLFLISLKAGGTGLNLTAADYVIHMDPWWNPAVEDQASDRAHRMGQKRPVTIYRLVAKDTIEDKIVELHKHKRDLANSLLEGGELSGKLSVEAMLALIKDVDESE